ncbi:MAG: serine O-acetyltransferase [Clostridiales bacterium]|nr:serine O-acetyltransferase [Clostridiales bacterium]
MFKKMISDLRSIKERDPAARSLLEIFFLYSGFHALMFYRVSHRLYKWNLKFLARMVSQMGRFFTGIEIHPAAKIGRGLFIDHGMGVVIGETAEIGDYVTIYQGVTLGGTGKDTGKRHPTIGNNVLIGAGAKVLGPFTVGDYARIAANAVVLDEVPPNSTVVGVPGRVVRLNGKRVPSLDQIHIPDPVAQELCRLRLRLQKLEQALNIESRDDGPNPCDTTESNKQILQVHNGSINNQET